MAEHRTSVSSNGQTIQSLDLVRSMEAFATQAELLGIDRLEKKELKRFAVENLHVLLQWVTKDFVIRPNYQPNRRYNVAKMRKLVAEGEAFLHLKQSDRTEKGRTQLGRIKVGEQFSPSFELVEFGQDAIAMQRAGEKLETLLLRMRDDPKRFKKHLLESLDKPIRWTIGPNRAFVTPDDAHHTQTAVAALVGLILRMQGTGKKLSQQNQSRNGTTSSEQGAGLVASPEQRLSKLASQIVDALEPLLSIRWEDVRPKGTVVRDYSHLSTEDYYQEMKSIGAMHTESPFSAPAKRFSELKNSPGRALASDHVAKRSKSGRLKFKNPPLWIKPSVDPIPFVEFEVAAAMNQILAEMMTEEPMKNRRPKYNPKAPVLTSEELSILRVRLFKAQEHAPEGSVLKRIELIDEEQANQLEQGRQ